MTLDRIPATQDDGPADGEHAVSAVRTQHVQALLQALLKRSPIYGTILSSISLQSVQKGSVTTKLILEDIHVNGRGSLHGAVSATIVDFVTGLAIASWDLRESDRKSVV